MEGYLTVKTNHLRRQSTFINTRFDRKIQTQTMAKISRQGETPTDDSLTSNQMENLQERVGRERSTQQ
jgi:hypothetical protein